MDKFVIRTKKPRLDILPSDSTLQEISCSGILDTRKSNFPPQTIVSWNANSIKLRCERGDVKTMVAFMKSQKADAILLQETRLKKEDQAAVEACMRSSGLGDEFSFYWSHHPNARYRGIAFIVRKSNVPLRVHTSWPSEAKAVMDATAKYDKPKGNGGVGKGETPDSEGRIMLAEYQHVYLLNLYVPNAGWYAEGRSRRDVWDKRLTKALELLACEKPLLVMGDLNVCHNELDVSHPMYFATAKKPGNVGGLNPGLPGQPGFVDFERQNFSTILEQAKLVDTFRALNPTVVRLTWGWAPSFEVGGLKGKYMGLDYALIDKRLWMADVVLRTEVGGPSKCFGSDHCAILLEVDWAKVASVNLVEVIVDPVTNS